MFIIIRPRLTSCSINIYSKYLQTFEKEKIAHITCTKTMYRIECPIYKTYLLSHVLKYQKDQINFVMLYSLRFNLENKRNSITNEKLNRCDIL